MSTPIIYVSDTFLSIVFWFVALVMSYVYGRYAYEIHKLDPDSRWRMAGQRWLNFVGAFSGWFSLYILVFYRISFDLAVFSNQLDWRDLILAFIAFLGVTGYLPHVTTSASSIFHIFKKS